MARALLGRYGISLLAAALLALAGGPAPPAAGADPVRLVPSQQPVDWRYFGMHIHRADSTTPWPAARFGSWRLWDAAVSWERLEPVRGQWQFERLDRLVRLAEGNGVEVLLTLGITPRWASARPDQDFVYGKGGNAEPRDMADWENYVRTVATRYRGRIRHYELWNEPTFTELDKGMGFYAGSAVKMVELAQVAHRVLKEVDPQNRLFSPGFVHTGERLDLFLQLGGGRYVDGVAHHFYSRDPEAMLYLVGRVQAVMARHGIAHLPLWNTEYGFDVPEPGKPLPSSGARDEAELAAYVARSLVLGVAAGVDRLFWYSWDGGNMGLTYKGGRPANKAGFAYAQTVRWLRGATVRACGSEDRAVWVCELARGQRRAWMVWNARGSATWAAPAGWRVTEYETLDGRLVRMSAHAGLPLGPAPMLLKSDAALWAAGS